MNPHRYLFSQYPLVQIAIPFCVGVCAVEYGPRVAIVLLVIGGGVFSIVALVAVVKSRLTLGAWSLLAAMFFAGAVLATEQPRVQEIIGGQTLVLTGVLDAPPEYAR